jgi:hypothetical protein
MTDPEAEEATLQLFKARWETNHPDNVADPAYVPFCTRNESYKPNQLGELGAWARITLIATTSDQVTHGTPAKIERRGRVMVQLFAEVNKIKTDNTVLDGNATAKQLAEDVLAALEKQRTGSLTIYAGVPSPLPETGIWNGYVVSLPYRFTTMRQ